MTACNRKEDRGEGKGHFYNASLLGNPHSLDPQYANDPSSNTVIKNLYSGLMMTDKSGNIKCCNAEKYEVSDDGLVYTFTLRKDNYWFLDYNQSDTVDNGEFFPVFADDYVFAFQRILNPSMQSPYANDFACIKGGADSLKGVVSPENIGVSAKDEYTVEIILEHPTAEFLTLLASNAAFPCNRDFFYSTNGRYGLDDKSVMSNGAFFVRQWFYDPYGVNNILYMKKNSANDREDIEIFPSYLSFSIEESNGKIKSLFKDSDIDCLTTLSDSYSTKKYNVSGSKAITLGLVFNPENKIYSNINLRKSLALAIDRTSLSKQISADVAVAYGIIPPAVSLMGRSYRELSSDIAFNEFNRKNAVDLFGKAKKEHNVESYETVKILVSTDNIDSGFLHLVSQQWQDVLGCYIGVEEVTSAEFEERIANGDYTIALYPLKADFNSGVSVFEQFNKNELLKNVSSSEKAADMIRKCTDASELVDKYTEAEKMLISEYKFIPLFYKKLYLVSGKANEDIIYDPFSEAVNFREAKNYD